MYNIVNLQRVKYQVRKNFTNKDTRLVIVFRRIHYLSRIYLKDVITFIDYGWF